MAGALVQSTNFGGAASVYGRSHNSRMLCKTSGVQMRGGFRPSLSLSIAGGGGFNAVVPLDNNCFQPKVPISISASSGRGSRCVSRATMLFEFIFTDEAVEVCRLAKDAAKRMGRHKYYGTEEILLGLIAEETSIAAKVLKSMGITLKDVQVEMEEIFGKDDWFVIPSEFQIPRLIENIRREAHKLGHDYVGPEHMLLALLCMDQTEAVGVLEKLGADPNNIRTQVIQMISESTEAGCITSNFIE